MTSRVPFLEQWPDRFAVPRAWPAWVEPRDACGLLGPMTLQPVHALHDAALVGAEAQGGHGWTCQTRGRLGALLLHMACDEATLWRDRPAATALTVSTRLPADACDPSLVDQVAAALACSALPPALLELGLYWVAAEAPGVTELLTWSALRDLGVGIALELTPDMMFAVFDDTGGGHFGRLPFTSLRLPAWVADQVEEGPTVRRMVRQAVHAAREQGALVAATGVRTGAQRDILADLGCATAQGPLFGLPMHPAAFHAALEQHQPGWFQSD